jgi:Flp pilus assembly protein TadD
MTKIFSIIITLFFLTNCTDRQKTSDNHTVDGAETNQYCLLGLQKFQAGDFNEAVKLYSHSFELDSTNTEAIYMRGLSKGKLGDSKGAISDYSILISISPNDAVAYSNRANEKAKLSDNDGALKDYEAAIKIDSTISDNYLNLGAHFLILKRLPDADKALSKAIELNPNDPRAYHNRALARGDMGQEELACSDSKKAFELGLKEAEDDIKDYCK